MSSILTKMNPLRTSFNEEVKKHEEVVRKKFIEEGGTEEDFVVPHDDEDKEFAELMALYNSKKKDHDAAVKKQESENLATKKQLIEDLKQLISNETNIAKAYQGLKDIREKWDKTGNVPKTEFKDIQHEFSLQHEYFYYNINIYKTLKEYDLEKNLQIKKELIAKMEALLHVEFIREVRERVEQLINEWDTTGPTFKDKWQEVRDQFWQAAAKVHLKIKEHFSEQKDKQKANFEAKRELCEQVEKICENLPNSEKAWRKKTEELKAMQEKWKTIGFATKKQNDKVWQRFRSALDVFFDKKKAFFGELKEEYGDHEKKKLALIEEAEKLKGRDDWKNTTELFVRLQKRWKAIGHAGQQKESRLWKKFNQACNDFFSAKKQYYDTLDDRLSENLKKKEAVVEKITAYKLTGDKEKDIEQLKALSTEWGSTGHVPKKKKDQAQKVFNQAIEVHYASLKLGSSERENMRFDSRLESLRNAKNAPELLDRERIKIKEKIRRLEAEVVQYENNLGFFDAGKGDNPFLKQAQEKVDGAKQELQKLRDQLKQVLN